MLKSNELRELINGLRPLRDAINEASEKSRCPKCGKPTVGFIPDNIMRLCKGDIRRAKARMGMCTCSNQTLKGGDDDEGSQSR
jgi:transposase